MIIRDILNKISWDPSFPSKKSQFFIQFTHRGVQDNNVVISHTQINKMHSGSFEYWNETIVRIPFHRIEKIFNNETHEILYKNRTLGAH